MSKRSRPSRKSGKRRRLPRRDWLRDAARRIQSRLDGVFRRWTKGRPIKEIGIFLRRLWVLGVASILISYVTKYKLEPEKYFPSLADITDPQTLLRFASDRWEVLLLGLN